MILEEKLKVNVQHTSISGLISNIGILTLLENVAFKHSDMAGFGFLNIDITHLSWILLAWKVKIFKRARYGDTVTVRTWAKASNKFNTYRDFEMLDENGNTLCIASSKWTLVDTEKGNITRITDEIIGKYNPEDKNVFENPEIDKLSQPSNYSLEYIYKTQRRDIDINQHVHNTNYLSLAYEALPDDIYYSNECDNIEIMYKKGIKLGDTSKCLYSYFENGHFVTIKSEDEKFLNAIVKLY